MRKLCSVLYYEYKMQIKRPAVWGVLLVAVAMAQLDNFPSAQNLARLEFLNQPAYFVCRVMSLDALLLFFGLAILLANRFPTDRKNGMKHLFLSYPLEKTAYILGKLLGGFCVAFSMAFLFLTLNTAVYFFAAPFAIALPDCLIPLGKALLCCALPASWFVGLMAVALPGVLDIRIFYALAAVLFGFNAAYVGSAETMPFYLITAGDLARLIWIHPRWPFVDFTSVAANGAFLLIGGLVFGSLLFCKPAFWRKRL